MLRIERHGPVTRLRFSTWRGRTIGYDVSVYFARGVLIDCAFPDAAAELAAALRELRPDAAIITHGHEDHGANAAVLAQLGIPTYASPPTLAVLRAARRVRFYRSYTWGQPRPFTGTLAPFDPAPLQVIATPGHCPDHQIVWDAEHGVLFSADLWLGVRDKLVHGEEDPRQLLGDLRAAIALAPAEMYDAHRGPVREPVRALAAKADWLEETIGLIDRRVADGRSDRAILRELFGREEWTGFVSRGEYSRMNMVRNVRSGRYGGAAGESAA